MTDAREQTKPERPHHIANRRWCPYCGDEGMRGEELWHYPCGNEWIDESTVSAGCATDEKCCKIASLDESLATALDSNAKLQDTIAELQQTLHVATKRERQGIHKDEVRRRQDAMLDEVAGYFETQAGVFPNPPPNSYAAGETAAFREAASFVRGVIEVPNA